MSCQTIGYVRLRRPIRGRWPWSDRPAPRSFLARIAGRLRRFERSTGRGRGLHYREAVPRNAMHMIVRNGVWSVEHVDAYNPHSSICNAIRHWYYDASTGPEGRLGR